MYAKFGAFTRFVTIFVNFDANGLDYEENKALSLTAQPVVPSTSQPLPSGILSGASIGKIEGCSFTFHVGGGQKVGSPPKPKKKRRVIISDDSDSD